MKITFNIDYRTLWGEAVYLCGDLPELGSGKESNAIRMSYDSGTWLLDVEITSQNAGAEIQYRYIIKNENGNERMEWGKPHWLKLGKDRTWVYDHWQEQPTDKSFYSSMFKNAIFKRENALNHKSDLAVDGQIQLRVFAPTVRPDEVLAIVGEGDILGNWDINAAKKLDDSRYPEWFINIPYYDLDSSIQYKFVKINLQKNTIVWESCDNRILGIDCDSEKGVIVLAGLRFNDPSPAWRGAGTAIPVFSIRTDDDFGVGDFLSLKKMVDWLAATRQTVLQILPINDTIMTQTWTDSYPYKANSTFALHPMFLNVFAVGRLKDEKRMQYYESLRKELNAQETVDYEQVNQAKASYMRELFVEIGETAVKSADFLTFVENNKFWLDSYVAFCILRNKFKTADFSKWDDYSVYRQDKVNALLKANPFEANLRYYIQYQLDKQLHESIAYAHARKIVLKGDIPIGISPTSADAWVNPRLFNLDCQAGAPPDDFSVLGQNWGLPTYNWKEMQKDGFQWWKNRMRKMAEYFDLYRIDHILGFFRIWEIPMDAVHGLLGMFNPALPFTPDELRQNYDFWINPEVQARPYIREYFIYDFFKEYTDEVKCNFLDDKGNGQYQLKEFVNTQKKIAAYFATKEKTDKNVLIENALMGLVDEVLFIEDPRQKGKYHPRISAQYTYAYRSLTDYEKWCFNRLYNDFFYHRHNDFWYSKAMTKLPAIIDSTDMLVCGEDLGMIPDCVPAVMSQLQILSLEIQRMPKDPHVEFGNPYNYPYLSVCTTSTHDMGGIRQWWEENREKTERFFHTMLGKSGNAPYFAEPWICDIIVSQHLESPAMLTIFPWQDWMSIDGTLRRENPKDEQINNPAITPHYWRYRMHLSLDKLLGETIFNDNIRRKIERTCR